MPNVLQMFTVITNWFQLISEENIYLLINNLVGAVILSECFYSVFFVDGSEQSKFRNAIYLCFAFQNYWSLSV